MCFYLHQEKTENGLEGALKQALYFICDRTPPKKNKLYFSVQDRLQKKNAKCWNSLFSAFQTVLAK